MKLWSDSFADGGAIPTGLAFGKHHPENHVELCENRNPHLAWSDLPASAESLVLICHDSDVPSKPDAVNREGVTVPADLPRVNFSHWVLVDLAPDGSPIEAGEFSSEITPGGNSGPAAPRGSRQGLNDYTSWFASDPAMAGSWFGYDGPCPPWNDEIIHHYHFTLYATDLPRCPVEGEFTAADVEGAIEGHVLASARITGRYAIYPGAM